MTCVTVSAELAKIKKKKDFFDFLQLIWASPLFNSRYSRELIIFITFFVALSNKKL